MPGKVLLLMRPLTTEEDELPEQWDATRWMAFWCLKARLSMVQ